MQRAQAFLESRPHLVPALVAAAMLFSAGLQRHEYGFYQALRWITCLAAVAVAVTAWTRLQAVSWVFLAVAVLFNPLSPIRLSRETWQPIDLVVGALFLVAAGVARKEVDASPP